jgi:hypothetical protein
MQVVEVLLEEGTTQSLESLRGGKRVFRLEKE